MGGFDQVFVIFLIIYHLDIIGAKPLGEFAYKRNIDFVFKPLPFKPIAFIKEKWGPFGIYGMKHGLAKRDLDSIKPTEGVKVPLEKSVTRLPAEVYEVPVEGEPPIAPVTPVDHGPIPAPPLGAVIITPPPIKNEPIKGLHTNIYSDDIINAYISALEKPIEKPVLPEENALPPVDNSVVVQDKKLEVPPLPKDEPNPIVRGSRLALYIGNILLDILAQFLSGPKTEQPVAI